MKKLVIGILAHVDAGKTTLSEAMLYHSGSIRKMGRVDNKDAFLDTYELERDRGITIFSKQALFTMEDIQVTLLDTPGHVDFSAEMERTLQVLDYAVLVINGADGIQGHTQTLWRLLKKYEIPVFLFINKMDQNGTDAEALLAELQQRLSEECINFGETNTEAFYEKIAVAEEGVLNQFLEEGRVEEAEIQRLIAERKVFPCFFGSALKSVGMEEFLQGLYRYVQLPKYGEVFGAKVFKIARDNQGNRLTFLKVTGGSLKARAVLNGNRHGEDWEEKVNQIRIYSGEKFTAVDEAEAGSVCAVLGLTKTYPGEGLGMEAESIQPVLEPVLTYCIELPREYDAMQMLPKLRMLEEEEPELHIVWDEALQEIHAKIMGEVQTEVLKRLIWERFGVEVGFGAGRIVYKETIADVVEGVGHFEPLRHYAEVHLLLEPGEPGSGMSFAADCSEDVLDKNWQRLIMTHLEEREHRGVLTGAAITDMRITIVAGKAHQKHTEGGDFRQATYRAVRQGLMEAESILLEPYYDFRLEIPESAIGRAMTDIEKLAGSFELPVTEGGMAVLTGRAPVATMRDYHKEVIAYTKGCGRLFCTLRGYEPCHNAEEVIEQISYDAERDVEHPTGSVFCAHGAGFVVPWDEVKDYMHVESVLEERVSADMERYGYYEDGRSDGSMGGKCGIQGSMAGNGGMQGGIAGNAVGTENSRGRTARNRKEKEAASEPWMGIEEIDAILERTSYANRRDKNTPRKGIPGRRMKTYGSQETVAAVTRTWKKPEKKDEYLLVDGYNIIFAWEELRELAEVNIDGARGKLLDILCNYQGIRKCNLIVVFDAYRVQGHDTEILDYHNIHVVYTKEAETADQYIEKFAHEHGRKANVTVATSDGLEQIIIRGQGCALLSARELEVEIQQASEGICQDYADRQPRGKNYLFDGVSEETAKKIEDLRNSQED